MLLKVLCSVFGFLDLSVGLGQFFLLNLVMKVGHLLGALSLEVSLYADVQLAPVLHLTIVDLEMMKNAIL